MPDSSQPGRLVGGRYRLVARLGAGGMGRVWRAHDERLGTDVAVKEVSLHFTLSEAQQAERLSRAEREARNTVRLRDQPGIVTVHDVVVEDGVPWIVMQLVDGRSLAEHVREHGPLSVENTAKVADTLLRALAAAHAAGIVHRDVKPANVLLADDGRVLLTDFGIAQHSGDNSLTATGVIIGSAEYLAPERARGSDSGPAGDLFSLGVTLYQAVEGVSPFRRDSPTATMSAVLFDQAPPPRRAGRLAPLLAGLLAKEPVQRPSVASALALLADGGDAGGTGIGAGGGGGIGRTSTRDLSEHTPHAPHHPIPSPTQSSAIPTYQPSSLVQPPRRTGLRIGLVAAAVVAVGAGGTLGAVYLTHSGKAPQTNPPVSTNSTTVPSTTPTSAPSTTPDTSPSTSPSTPHPAKTTTSTTPSPHGAKAGCAEALRDLTAFNKANPAANGGRDFQIAADRDLSAKLADDAALATDPAVKSAIQRESDGWKKFADFYAAGSASGMFGASTEIGNATSAAQSACTG
ncbi:MAG: serine/threonine protein kinase [Catenulisporales bacterium]|nr:serine/threonine protein kinase [Catenulisporales bacterium]